MFFDKKSLTRLHKEDIFLALKFSTLAFSCPKGISLTKFCKMLGVNFWLSNQDWTLTKFARQLKKFFYQSTFGKKLSKRIVPEPLFIESDVNYLVQIADLCIYVVNVAYRKKPILTEPCRSEVQEQFANYIHSLEFNTYQYKIQKGRREKHHVYGVSFTKKPYIEWEKYKEKRQCSRGHQ